ncbi:unnamed protein product, partial [Ectocarpus sp. 12 AP-2014]
KVRQAWRKNGEEGGPQKRKRRTSGGGGLRLCRGRRRFVRRRRSAGSSRPSPSTSRNLLQPGAASPSPTGRAPPRTRLAGRGGTHGSSWRRSSGSWARSGRKIG